MEQINTEALFLNEIKKNVIDALVKQVKEDLEIEAQKLIKKHVAKIGERLTGWLIESNSFYSFTKDETSFIIRLGLPKLMQEAFKSNSRDWLSNYLLQGLEK